MQQCIRKSSAIKHERVEWNRSSKECLEPDHWETSNGDIQRAWTLFARQLRTEMLEQRGDMI